MLPNIVFQIPQPSLIVIYQSLNIFPLREGHQIYKFMGETSRFKEMILL